MRLIVLLLSLLLLLSMATAQNTVQPNDLDELKDSLYIDEVENFKNPDKVLHAEPLFIDLIRDLGARKGEKEWNIGMGIVDNNTIDRYEALVEYEWAPIDRLGLEIELPFSFYYPTTKDLDQAFVPKNKLNSIKMAAQYSFFVSEKLKTSMAIGYIHELEFTEFNNYGKEKFYEGNVYNPFFVAAKRWGQNFHTLIYTGPQIFQHFENNSWHTDWQINTNIHYMISGTRNFVGVEFNKMVNSTDFDMTIRPQMRVGFAENLLIGIVAGIPISRENERFSTFVRLIYEPPHKKH
jgi:hypothetical protein